jgi:ABC-type multidrug transport system fused ATPase/permease subunit
MRFYEIDKGTILSRWRRYPNYARKTFGARSAWSLQDTWLYNGTIRENIRYGNNDATDEDVYAAAKAARVDHFIDTCPAAMISC